MIRNEDPRLAATRKLALETALSILQERGVLAITYASISKAAGISRSTLYRHWPAIEQLRNDTFKLAAFPPNVAPKSNGPLQADLTWILSIPMDSLNETAWGKVAPQIIAAAAIDEDAQLVINNFMRDRIANVKAVFTAAIDRGELDPKAPIDNLVEMAIAVLYFRKYIAGLPIDQKWLDTHVESLCQLAGLKGGSSK